MELTVFEQLSQFNDTIKDQLMSLDGPLDILRVYSGVGVLGIVAGVIVERRRGLTWLEGLFFMVLTYVLSPFLQQSKEKLTDFLDPIKDGLILIRDFIGGGLLILFLIGMMLFAILFVFGILAAPVLFVVNRMFKKSNVEESDDILYNESTIEYNEDVD